MTTRATLLAAFCALVLVAGCGDDDGPPSSRQTTTATPLGSETDTGTTPAPAPSSAPAADDKRGVALDCIANVKGIDARAIGDKGIQIGPGEDGPRIDFFQSSLEAEAEQFEGRGEGAEQVGAALFYVREAPEDQLIAIEDCLNEQ